MRAKRHSPAPRSCCDKNLPHLLNLIPAGTVTTLKGSGQGFSAGESHLYVNQQATLETTGKCGAYDFVAGLGYTDTRQAKREISDPKRRAGMAPAEDRRAPIRAGTLRSGAQCGREVLEAALRMLAKGSLARRGYRP